MYVSMYICLHLRTFIKLSSNVNMIFPKGKENDFLKNSIICVLSKARIEKILDMEFKF